MSFFKLENPGLGYTRESFIVTIDNLLHIEYLKTDPYVGWGSLPRPVYQHSKIGQNKAVIEAVLGLLLYRSKITS